jgi:cob(I)alamin adenosyltransferase
MPARQRGYQANGGNFARNPMSAMKIYTRKGDTGTTQLIGGARVGKDHLRIEAYGTVDELNSWLGVLADEPALKPRQEFIRAIQHRLFTIGSLLAEDPQGSRMNLPGIAEADVQTLEQDIDRMDVELPALRNFVLPGGHPANSWAHVARTVCRRAERHTVALHQAAEVPQLVLQYLNRLSDWLFTLARWASHSQQVAEIPWLPHANPTSE